MTNDIITSDEKALLSEQRGTSDIDVVALFLQGDDKRTFIGGRYVRSKRRSGNIGGAQLA